jgi:hypothetical protein
MSVPVGSLPRLEARMLKWNGILKIAIATGLATLAGACWETDKPLILAEDSVHPVPTGRYDYHRDDEVVTAEIVRFPGGGYVATIDDIPGAALALQVNPEWFVVQAGDAETGNLYGLAHLTETRVDFYDPPCEDDLEAIPGVNVSLTDCSFDTVDALLSAARHQIDKGEPGDPASWLDLETRSGS